MGTSIISYEDQYDDLKGSVSIPPYFLTWDFTDGLTKEQWVERKSGVYLRKGRLLMPYCGIF